jgi:hypothetical protein
VKKLVLKFAFKWVNLYRYTEDDEKSNVSAVYKKTTRRARQFMNRPGGFNRPLPDEVNGVRSNKI